MFQLIDLNDVDRSYFEVIIINPAEVTVMSKNTRHVWYIHNSEFPTESSCVIYHKHKVADAYHIHGKAASLQSALNQIKKHDSWVIRNDEKRKG